MNKPNEKMSHLKRVKVDNWGIFFLQRLKHFFNRTDYCDLTLQFQDYAQLKVHRLVLNACTEYFELLERTCEMYDDCLIMPDDLQVDVVIPIVNFMYTGQLEYDYRIYDRLYSTAQIMNMSVLTKLLDAQKQEISEIKPKKEVIIMNSQLAEKESYARPSTSNFSNFNTKKAVIAGRQYGPGPGLKVAPAPAKVSIMKPFKKPAEEKPRPTRYEVPEELENDDIFESSFSDISYESKPLMRPTKRPSSVSEHKFRNIYDEASCSRKFEELQASSSFKRPRLSSDDLDPKHIDLDQVNEFAYQQKIRSEYLEQGGQSEDELFDSLTNDDSLNISRTKENTSSLFGQMEVNSSPNITVKQSGKSNLDHAKIISEVLKKYPHLVKSNKNIKLKIMSGYNNKPQTNVKSGKTFVREPPMKPMKVNSSLLSNKSLMQDDSCVEWSYINKDMNSEAMAKLVSLGIANVTGPWLCLICGTPGKALNFLTFNKYYHHLVDVHKEKISVNICEYCGYKSGKRNHLLHHLYTKHDVPPPSTHSFPKCNQCPYIALTEAFLIKHKLTHIDNRDFTCSVCNSSFRSRAQLLNHIQATGHKISPDRKTNNQCVYCNKIFLRETNLYTHLKLAHKDIARKDGIIDNSDEEDFNYQGGKYDDDISNYEYSGSPQEEHVNIKQEYDGKMQIISHLANKKPAGSSQQMFLNSNIINKATTGKPKVLRPVTKNINNSPNIIHSIEQNTSESESLGNVTSGIAASLGLVDRFVIINNNEYILQSGQEEPLSANQTLEHVQVALEDHSDTILPDMQEDISRHSTIETSVLSQQATTSQIMASTPIKSISKPIQQQGVKSSNIRQNQTYQIVLSGNQQYKAVVPTTSIVYATNAETTTTAPSTSAKYEHAQNDNLNLEHAPQGTVMVLQDEEYNVTQTIPNDGSNIVVVYSHPLQDDKQYVQVDQSHFEELAESHEIVSHVEQIGHTEGEVVISDQGLVHETVETWQEENVGALSVDKDISEEEIQGSDELVIHQDIIENENMATTEELNMSTEEKSEHIDETSLMETHSGEIEITSHIEIQNMNESQENLQEVSVEDDAAKIPCQSDDVEERINEQSTLDESIIEKTNESMEVECSQDFETKDEIQADQILKEDISVESEPAKKIFLGWSDDETPKIGDETTVVESNVENTEEIEAEEESIENIEREVLKHIQEKEKEEEPALDIIEEPSPAYKSNEESQDNVSAIMTTDEHGGDSHDTDLSPNVSVSNTTPSLKQKTVEKISTLLNDWDDNDSQSDAINDSSDTNIDSQVEIIDSSEKRNTDITSNDSKIHKLVSDWDDDDEK